MTNQELADCIEKGASHEDFFEDSNYFLVKDSHNRYCGCAIGAAMIGLFGDPDLSISEMSKTLFKGSHAADFVSFFYVEEATLVRISELHVQDIQISSIVKLLREDKL